MFPNESEVPISNFVVHPGDSMFVEVEYLPNLHSVDFTICDFAADVDKCVTPVQSVPGPSGYGGEWTVERTEEWSQLPRLTNFGVLWISSANVLTSQNGSWQSMGSVYNTTNVLIDCAGNELASDGDNPSIGSTGFREQWFNWGYRTDPINTSNCYRV
jgi:hypothetical protein